MMRRAGVVVLVLGGVLLGMLMLLSSFLVIDAEDDVPVAAWVTPSVLGVAAIAAGIRLSPRSAHRPPPGGW